jgi:N utilization substance protein B
VTRDRSFSKRARIKARRTAVQALYQWLMTGKPVAEVISEFENSRDELKNADIDYFKDLLRGATKCCDEIDNRLAHILDRPLKDIDPVERAVLYVGYYELVYHPELPWRVVINESVELAKLFGAEQSHKYINGVLDKLAHSLRSEEIENSP